jgi:hypothetical protein
MGSATITMVAATKTDLYGVAMGSVVSLNLLNCVQTDWSHTSAASTKCEVTGALDLLLRGLR